MPGPQNTPVHRNTPGPQEHTRPHQRPFQGANVEWRHAVDKHAKTYAVPVAVRSNRQKVRSRETLSSQRSSAEKTSYDRSTTPKPGQRQLFASLGHAWRDGPGRTCVTVSVCAASSPAGAHVAVVHSRMTACSGLDAWRCAFLPIRPRSACATRARPAAPARPCRPRPPLCRHG